MNYVLQSVFLHPLGQVCRNKYIDPRSLLAKFGLSTKVLHQEDIDIDHVTYTRVINELAKVSKDPLIGLDIGKALFLTNIGHIGLLLAKQEVISNIYPILDYLFNAQHRGARHQLEIIGKKAYHNVNFLLADQVDCEQLAYLSLAAYHNVFSQILGDRWVVDRVLLKTDKIIDDRRLQGFFNCPIEYGQARDALEFSSTLIFEEANIAFKGDRKSKMEIAAILETVNDIDVLIGKYIEYYLPMGKTNIHDIANAMGVHQRVLQNLLKARDTSYKHILENYRTQLACKLLKNSTRSMADIAIELGYSDSRAFGRAFQTWMQVTPLKWRKLNSVY